MKSTINKNTDNSGRRDFIRKTWKWLGIIAAAEFSIFSFNLMGPAKKSKKNIENQSIKIAGNVEDFAVNSVTPDRVNKFYLVRDSEGGFMALSLTCSHLGCSVKWDEVRNQFICPCHSSAFDKFGNVLNSPAPRPLDYYPVIVEEGKIKVDIGQKTRRSKFDKSQLTYVQ